MARIATPTSTDGSHDHETSGSTKTFSPIDNEAAGY
jgi:hypothetical protein